MHYTYIYEMKRLFILFLILFSVCSIRAQNLNFKDTNSLKSLLCSHAWTRYAVNEDSSIADRIIDSIKFYPNKTFYESPRPNDDMLDWPHHGEPISGKWSLAGTGQTPRDDSAANYINIAMESPGKLAGDKLLWKLVLIDGHRKRGSKFVKLNRVQDEPFILYSYYSPGGIFWDGHHVWRVPKQ